MRDLGPLLLIGGLGWLLLRARSQATAAPAVAATPAPAASSYWPFVPAPVVPQAPPMPTAPPRPNAVGVWVLGGGPDPSQMSWSWIDEGSLGAM